MADQLSDEEREEREQLAQRLDQLARAISKGQWSEFSMRVPAEPQRDADLVLSRAAALLRQRPGKSGYRKGTGMSCDPHVNRQNAIEAACQNAIKAFWAEAAAATRERRIMNSRLGLAEALEAIEIERTADLPGVTPPFTIGDCIAHLRATALPRRSS